MKNPFRSYFRILIDSSFRRNDGGKLVFYPYGILGKGYIVEDAGLAKQILRFFKIYCAGSFAVLIIACATVGTFGALVLAPVVVIIWVIKVHQWSRKMNPTLLKRRDAKLLNGDLIK